MVALVLGAILLLGAVVLPGWWVQRVMKRYSSPTDRYQGTGSELARHLLDRAGLEEVAVEPTDHGDHYDPEARAVRLTESNFNTGSLTAITVAAHEVGHAIQHADGYRPLIVRTQMVRTVQRFQRLGMVMIGAAPIALAAIKLPRAALILLVFGAAGLASGIFVHLATLPTEFDASFRRALPILERGGYLKDEDRRPARRILTAAALTYVAASMMSLVNFAWWLRVLRP